VIDDFVDWVKARRERASATAAWNIQWIFIETITPYIIRIRCVDNL